MVPLPDRLAAITGWTALILAIVATTGLSPTAFAESTGQAIRTFGLVGAWSPDCSADPGGGIRFIYDAPDAGGPTMQFRAMGHAMNFDILSAAIAQEQLRMQYRMAASERNMPTAGPFTGRPFEATLTKAGEDEVVLHDPIIAGPAPVPLHKCSH
jgi:hypothetical protein